MCPWSEITDLSMRLISVRVRAQHPAFQGWNPEDYPALLDDVEGIFAGAENAMLEHYRREAESKAKREQRRDGRGSGESVNLMKLGPKGLRKVLGNG